MDLADEEKWQSYPILFLFLGMDEPWAVVGRGGSLLGNPNRPAQPYPAFDAK